MIYVMLVVSMVYLIDFEYFWIDKDYVFILFGGLGFFGFIK